MMAMVYIYPPAIPTYLSGESDEIRQLGYRNYIGTISSSYGFPGT
jgi:hypothetical protein